MRKIRTDNWKGSAKEVFSRYGDKNLQRMTGSLLKEPVLNYNGGSRTYLNFGEANS